MAADVTDSTFAAEVLESPEPVLVDFWAPWCGPCRMVAPVLEQISSERGIRLVKLNTDENPETASRYGVMSLPTMMVFKGGQPGQPIVGALPKTRLDAQIADQVSA